MLLVLLELLDGLQILIVKLVFVIVLLEDVLFFVVVVIVEYVGIFFGALDIGLIVDVECDLRGILVTCVDVAEAHEGLLAGLDLFPPIRHFQIPVFKFYYSNNRV